VRDGLVAMVVLVALGYGVGLVRGSLQEAWADVRRSVRSLSGIAVPIVITVIAMVPAVAGVTGLSVGLRIGPDSAGYAISARAISQGETASQVQDEALRQAGGGSVAHVISPTTRLIDTTPSFTTQVAAEFLTGAHRWALSGTVAMIIYIIGPQYLWLVLSLLAALAMLAACTGIWFLIRRLTSSRWAAVVATVLFGLSPSMLNAWHEGALAGTWVMPACVLIVLPLLRLGEMEVRWAAAALGLGLMGLLPSYSDALFAWIAVFAAAMVLSIPLLRSAWWRAWWPLVAGAVGGVAVIAPASVVYLASVPLNLRENGSAGWSQPHWPSVGEALGLGNPYGSSEVATVPRSAAQTAVGGLADALAAGFLGGLIYRQLRRPATVLLSSVVVAMVAVYVQTRYVANASNYQYFKTIAILSPAGALAVGRLLGDALSRRESTPSRTCRRDGPRPWLLLVVSAVVAAVVAASGVAYVVTYRQQGTTVPSALSALSTSPRAEAVFAEYNVLAPGGLLSNSVGAEVDLYWLGRNQGNPPTRIGDRIDHPVGLLIFEQQCPGFACLEGLDPRTTVLRSDGVALVRLDGSTRALSRLSETTWPTWVATRFAQDGGGEVLGMIPAIPAKGGPKDAG
jgi:hypothetical protein